MGGRRRIPATGRSREGGRDLGMLGERSMEWEGHGRQWLRIGAAGVEACGRSGGRYAVGAAVEEEL